MSASTPAFSHALHFTIRRALAVALSGFMAVAASSTAEPTREEAAQALRQGVEYFRHVVSVEGGYLWVYTADFTMREGEKPTTPTTVWVQPPGTPSVGLAYLTAYELTGDAYYLEAAQETAHALLRGQLQSGGWDYRIDFDPKERAKYAYRVDGNKQGRNITTLDDNTTQAALRCLMRVDRALDFKDAALHEGVEYALRKLMEAQYPNGAWPQRFSAAPDADKYPVKAASYPETWSKTFPKVNYIDYYTFNDNTLSDVIELMFLAAEIYQDDTYRASARRGADFMLLAQMPEPQPGWAQQYDAQMQPAWARKFEPPSITGGESQGVMRTLLRAYTLTGDRKYLEPLPRALEYYRTCVLDDGRLARFYEFKTNRPTYFTKDYEVTYSDADMPTHYAFKVRNQLDAIATEYHRLAAPSQEDWQPTTLLHPAQPAKATPELAQKAADVIAAQNKAGAWLQPASKTSQGTIPPGTPSIYASTFTKNIIILANFVAAN